MFSILDQDFQTGIRTREWITFSSERFLLNYCSSKRQIRNHFQHDAPHSIKIFYGFQFVTENSTVSANRWDANPKQTSIWAAAEHWSITWCHKEDRQEGIDLLCTLELFVLWQSSWKPPCVSSSAWGALWDFKQTQMHTHTRRVLKQALSQSASSNKKKRHKLAFIKPDCKHGHTCVAVLKLTDWSVTGLCFFLARRLPMCVCVCVLLSPVSVWLPWDWRQG